MTYLYDFGEGGVNITLVNGGRKCCGRFVTHNFIPVAAGYKARCIISIRDDGKMEWIKNIDKIVRTELTKSEQHDAILNLLQATPW